MPMPWDRNGKLDMQSTQILIRKFTTRGLMGLLNLWLMNGIIRQAAPRGFIIIIGKGSACVCVNYIPKECSVQED